ncbi:hypothetical protein C8R42DRAFT_82563 [Lentinula raphanica]|nr:hypothetical protein C8R42DRAFT_82563 [Lentinula raphanica]
MSHHSNSPTSTAHIKLEEQPAAKLSSPSILPLKRKTPPTDNDASESNTVTAVVLDNDSNGSADDDADEQDEIRDPPRASREPPPSFPAPPSEYETGRIDCPSCHKQVAFRDEETGKLSIKRWQQHWESCAGQTQENTGRRSPPTRSVQQRSIHNLVSSHMDNYQPESDDPRFPSMMSHPPTKRRRAKRTEEERIAYLRADPYVAKFEAYRVLCASCDKWIRLRPNSTYCSIPWDAHRKSCLSKKISNKNTYALDERNSLFTKDPDVRKFDAERVLCAVCDHWIPINSEDHLQAVQTWLNHRGDCAKRAAAAAGVSHHGPTPSTGSGGSPPQHVLRSFNNFPPRSHLHIPARLPLGPPPSGPLSPPVRDRDTDPYRRHHPQSYSQLAPRRDASPTASRDSQGRNESRVKPERKERESSQQQQGDLDVDADGDPDADADADGEAESDLDSNQIRVVDLSHPPSGQSPVAANNTNGKSFQPSNAHSTRIHPSDPSTPSGIDAGPQSETIMYSPAAGIFPPGPANESRRRNAEQRAATLRADTLIKHVEPNRVFCSLCEKWVQLRQDSSFCAYPWFQHRGKCLARYQRRAQKAAEIEDIKKRRAMGGGSSVRTVYAHDPQRYGQAPPYPPRSRHPSTSHHHHAQGHFAYPPSHPHRMYPEDKRLLRAPHPHRSGEEDGMDYFSGSDQGHSDDEDGMNTRFDYRGLSASASPASEGRSVSVASMASVDEDQGPEYVEDADVYERPGLSRTQSQQQRGKSVESDAAAPDVICSDAHRNGDSRPDGSEDKVRKAGTDADFDRPKEVGKQGLSTSQPQGESSASTSGARPPNQAQLTNMHRPIAPRDAPHVIQPPRSRTDVHHQNRPADPGHSLIPVHPQHGKPYHHHHGAINGGPGPYRYSQHPREQTYTDPRPRSDSAHAYAYEGGRIYREKSHRVHRGPSQVRSHGPYGNGALPSSYPSDLSPQNGNGRGVLADLDSPAGRKQFVSHSIAYLFQTTYDCSPCSSDELSISALVAYLNAAMPMDKHEDFDTAEVVKCVGALREKGKVLLEGDVVRKVRKSRE